MPNVTFYFTDQLQNMLFNFNIYFAVAITGVWFYEESECTRIAQKLEALVQEETQRRRPNAAQEKAGVDILSLLTKAHGEYEQVRTLYPPRPSACHHFQSLLQKGKPSVPVSASSNVDVVRPTALRPTSNGVAPQSTTLSVADLFATEPAGSVAPMPLHHCGSLFERLLSAGTPTGVPPPPIPNAELHTAQSLERELRGKEKVLDLKLCARKNHCQMSFLKNSPR